MRNSSLIIAVFFSLFATSSYAQSNKIEINDYLDHLRTQLINSQQGILIYQGRTHVELSVVATKNENGEIRSYVVEDNSSVNPASVHKLSFDIDVTRSQQKAATGAALATTPAQEHTQPVPWYKHFFTW